MHILVRTLAPELSSVFEHCLDRATYYVSWPGAGAPLGLLFIEFYLGVGSSLDQLRPRAQTLSVLQ